MISSTEDMRISSVEIARSNTYVRVPPVYPNVDSYGIHYVSSDMAVERSTPRTAKREAVLQYIVRRRNETKIA
jgi:hypothetical protein